MRPVEASEISLLLVGSMLLRAKNKIIVAALLGGMLGASVGLLRKRVYISAATFIPQGSEMGGSGLAFAASQFGLNVPGAGGGWGPPIYIEVLKSREILEPLARATIAVPEMGGRQVPVMELLDLPPGKSAGRIDRGIAKLGGLITTREDKVIGAVKLSVSTRWPSVSFWIAQELVRRVDKFNLETRKSQAAAERKFVETQAREAERALRAAEDRLQVFRQQNRIIATPQLAIMLNRLERDVGMAQDIYHSLLKSREEARIREVRDTPVLTVIDTPRLPVLPQPRGTVRKTLLGLVAGAAVAVALLVLTRAFGTLRRRSSEEAREFIQAFDSVKPRMFRRGN